MAGDVKMNMVSWNVTNQCDLRCGHCYRDAGAALRDELSNAEAKIMLAGMAEAGFKLLILSGGEPLQRPDVLDLAQYATGLGLRVVLGTNGIRIASIDYAHKLKASGVRCVGISLDSVKVAAHEAFRGVKGCWGAAVAAMQHCRDAGLPFQVHMTLMPWNVGELEEMAHLAAGLGARAVHYFFVVSTGRAAARSDLALGRREYHNALEHIISLQASFKLELKPTCGPQFMRIAAESGVPERYSRGCLAGLSYCVVTPVGEVRPCAYLPQVAGNVRERGFADIWRDSELFAKLRSYAYSGKCGLCAYKGVCGGCRARAYAASGDVLAEDPWCE